jgi:hypothetical protein
MMTTINNAIRYQLSHFVAGAAAAALTMSLVSTCTPAERKEWYELDAMNDEILDQVVLFYLGEAGPG